MATMKRARRNRVTLVVILGLLLTSVAVSAGSSIAVTIESTPYVTPGAEFVAKVGLPWVERFDAAQFDLGYDPDIFELTHVVDGQIANAVIPCGWGFMPPGEPGTIRVVSNVAGAASVTGSGYLAELHFHVAEPHWTSTEITLSGGVLSNVNGLPIPAVWTGTTVYLSGQHTHRLFLPYVVDRLKHRPN
jgi:hypothetical protein